MMDEALATAVASPLPVAAGRTAPCAQHRPLTRLRRKRSWTITALASWRASAYRFFAALFLPPNEERWRWLRAAAESLQRADDALAAFAFFSTWDRLLRALQESDADTARRLEAEYVRQFVASAGVSACLPYEWCYVSAPGQAADWIAAQLERTYARAGLQVARASACGVDHLAVELEFMAFLCGHEAAAWARMAAAEATRALGQQRAFLRLHLGHWLPAFALQVQGAVREPLYAQAAEATHAFVQHDRELVDLLLGGLKLAHEADNTRLPIAEDQP